MAQSFCLRVGLSGQSHLSPSKIEAPIAPWWLSGRSLEPDARGLSSEDDPNAMGRAVLCQRDSYLISGQRLAVELRTGDPTTDPMGVLDHDFVARRGVLKHDFEARPMLGNARREEQECSLKPKAKNRFDAGSIHPPGRSGVPRPSAASEMRRF